MITAWTEGFTLGIMLSQLDAVVCRVLIHAGRGSLSLLLRLKTLKREQVRRWICCDVSYCRCRHDLAIIFCKISAGHLPLHSQNKQTNKQTNTIQIIFYYTLKTKTAISEKWGNRGVGWGGVLLGLFRNRNSWNKPKTCSFSCYSDSRLVVEPSW